MNPRVQRLLDALSGDGGEVDVDALAPLTPAGPVDLPVARVDLAGGVQAAGHVDRAWLAAVDEERAAARRAVGDAEVEAALRVALPLATELLDPVDDADVDAHVASGAQLWLVAGAVVSAVRGAEPDPFAPWARLISAGWWPVGPSGGRLVVSETGCR